MTASPTNAHWALPLIGLAVVCGLALSQLLPPTNDGPAVEWLDQPRPIPAFTLTSGTLTSGNNDFTLDSLRGHWQVLALGFTSCPDICPTTLAELARLRSALGENPLRVIFVSIDPERDSPQRLVEYVNFFGEGILAITGRDTQLHPLAESLGMNYRREGSLDNPRISHSPTIALIGPDGFLRARLRPGFDTQRAAQELSARIGAGT